jgi:hypothetical protein
MNREQRRHPEKAPSGVEATGEGTAGAKTPNPEHAPMESAGRAQDDDPVRAKASGHKKTTADKWNQ